MVQGTETQASHILGKHYTTYTRTPNHQQPLEELYFWFQEEKTGQHNTIRVQK